MRVGIFHNRKLVYISLTLFFILILNGAYLNGVGPGDQKADQVFQQGVDLYNEGEYVKAISKLTRVLILTESQPLLTDSYFYLSLCNYYLENSAVSKAWIKKLLEAEPQREASNLYPGEYIQLFNQAKREAVSELMERDRMRRRTTPPPEARVAPPPRREPQPPAVVYQTAPRRRGGGNFLLYALGGALIAGAALYFFVFKEDKETTGSIQINSNPSGAKVFLDAVDTGNVSNCTLSDITPGSHVVRLIKEGYMEFEQSVSVTAGETAMVSGTLTMHTLTVTQPEGGATWGTGQQVTIRWESNANSGISGVIAKNRGVLSPVNPTGQIARMNRLRMFRRSPSQRSIGQQVRTLRSHADQNAKSEGDALPGTTETSGGNLNSPRNRYLNTLHFPGANPSGLNTPHPMVLSTVKIELYKGGSMLRTIVGNTPNDGSHNWTVPADLAVGSNYKVRISCPGDAAVYAESDNFSIAKVGSLKVESTPQTASIFIDGVDTGKKTNFLFKNVAAGNRVVKVVKEGYGDEQKTVAVKSGERTTVTFTLKEMNLDVIQPNSVSVWGFGEDVDIRWTTTVVTDPDNGPEAGEQDVTTVKIELYKGNSRVRTIASSTENDGLHAWTVSSTLSDGANYKIRVSAAQKPSVSDDSSLFCITKKNYVFDTTWGESGSGISQFNYPRAIALGKYGRIYVADTGNHRIQKFGQAGNYVTQWGSLGSGNGQLNSPWGVCGDPNSGYIYVADTYNHRVQKFSNTGTYIRKWGSSGSANGQFRYPAGIAVDTSGYVYVVDNNNHRVQKFTSTGVFVSSWGGYLYPFGAAFGPLDNYLYVVDKNNQRIRVTTPWGSFVEQWGTFGSGDGQFNYPYDIAFDKAGFSYVVEWGNDRIQKFTPRKRFVSKWGQLGSGYGEFNNPQGVVVDELGNVYVLDSQNHRVQKFK